MTASFLDGVRALFSVSVSSQPSFFASSTTSSNVTLRPEQYQTTFRTSLTQNSPSSAFLYSIENAMRIDTINRGFQNLQFRLGRDPRKPPEARKKIVILGTGWAAMSFLTRLDVAKYDVTTISPRNYFTFTPLLPSVSGGTLSPRACLEPVRNKLIRGGKKVMEFHEAWATNINADKKTVTCQTALGKQFDIPYDNLVIAVGAESNTFGIPGVKEHAHFLKEVENARQIHKAVLDNFEKASLPNVSNEEKERLLHFVIVGGGPTGVETAAEISDFVREDAKRHFPDLAPYCRVTLIEMLDKLLPMFHRSVSDYTLKNLNRIKVDTLLQSRVTKISDTMITVADSKNNSRDIPYGFVLWASGVGNVPFIKKLLSNLEAQKGNRIMKVNEKLQVIGLPGVYAMGDCSIFTPKPMADDVEKLHKIASASEYGASYEWLEKKKSGLEEEYPQVASFDFKTLRSSKQSKLSIEEFKDVLSSIDKAFKPPPPTAQNAKQEGCYLASIFNRHTGDESKDKILPCYIFQWRGSMAYVGDGHSVIETANFGTWLGGRSTLLAWKFFYWNEQMSIANKVICIIDWARAALRGRDVGRDHTQDAIPPTPTA